jgi:hypothetical protein
MNTTVSETTTVEATERPVQPKVVRDELPLNTTVSETTTIESTTRPVERREELPDALQDFVLARLLRMANDLQKAGETRHAMFLFSKLRKDYPGSLEAEQASEHLIEVAEHFEREGDARQAQSVYEELL